MSHDSCIYIVMSMIVMLIYVLVSIYTHFSKYYTARGVLQHQ